MSLPIFYNNSDEWSQAVLLYDAALKEINTKLEILNNEFQLTHSYNPIEHITSRIKSPESIAKKIRHKNMELTTENIVKYINDVAGIRIICSFTADIYKIADLICKQTDVKVLKVKDYIRSPKENGYMSYHMIVSVPIFLSEAVIETKVEVQIRTIAMDFWASLEHKIYYKFEGNAPERISNQLKECADIVAYLDKKMLSINNDIQQFHDEEEVNKISYPMALRESVGTVYPDLDEENLIDGIEVEANIEQSNSIPLGDLDALDDLSMISRIEKVVYEKDLVVVDKEENKALPIEEEEQLKIQKSVREGITSFFFRKREKEINAGDMRVARE